MSQEPYETNSDANDMAPSVEPNIELANEVLAKSLPLIERVAENPTVKEILEAQNLELLQVSVSPAEITQDEILDSEKLLSKETLEVVRTPISQVEIDAVHQELLLMPRDFIKTSLNSEGNHVDASDLNTSLVDAALVNPIPAETLAAIEEQNAKAQLVTEDIPKVVYIPTSAPLADAISTNTQGQPTHIQVGHIHFRNPA